MTNNLLKGVRRMRDSVTYMEILEEGIAEGIARGRSEGIAEGRSEGISEGRITGEQEMLLVVAERRFGAPPSDVRSRIAAIQSPDHLLELANRLLSVETWDEFLADAS
jgi:predicted transposase YdaD